jgi:hypothetical protein
MAESEGAQSVPTLAQEAKPKNKINFSGMWKPKSHFTHAEGQLALSLSRPSSVQESVEKLRKSALIHDCLCWQNMVIA